MGAFSIGDLVSICNLLGVDHEGTKEQMRQNIIKSLMDINTLVTEDDDHSQDGSDTNDDEIHRNNRGNDRNGADPEENNQVQPDNHASDQESQDGLNDRYQLADEIGTDRNSNKSSMKFALSYKDVEDFIRPFNGEDDYPVER